MQGQYISAITFPPKYQGYSHMFVQKQLSFCCLFICCVSRMCRGFEKEQQGRMELTETAIQPLKRHLNNDRTHQPLGLCLLSECKAQRVVGPCREQNSPQRLQIHALLLHSSMVSCCLYYSLQYFPDSLLDISILGLLNKCFPTKYLNRLDSCLLNARKYC